MIRYPPRIHVGTVTAVQVHNKCRRTMPDEHHVMPADEFALDRDIVVLGTPHQQPRLIEGYFPDGLAVFGDI